MKYKMIRIITALSLISIGGMFLTGCASITRGSTESLVVESVPSHARVTLSNGMSGITPASFILKRKSNLQVIVEKPGYESVVVNVGHQTAGSGAAGMAGNLVSFGVIGGAVDVVTGATQELCPNPVTVHLEPLRKPIEVSSVMPEDQDNRSRS